MRNRAYRRAQQAKAKERATKKVKDWFGSFGESPVLDPVAVGKATNTRTLCSCGMCGNPRRLPSQKKCVALTMQEKRQRDRENGEWE